MKESGPSLGIVAVFKKAKPESSEKLMFFSVYCPHASANLEDSNPYGLQDIPGERTADYRSNRSKGVALWAR